jgi:leucine dehydrogenase
LILNRYSFGCFDRFHLNINENAKGLTCSHQAKPRHQILENYAVVYDTLRDAPAQRTHVFSDPASGLEAVIVLDSLARGPAAGGCRFWHYPDRAAMTADAVRLARGMTYKNAMAGLPLGGGKAVISRPAAPFDRAALFRAFGDAVRELGGNYVTAEDVGTTVDDMRTVAERTRHVAGLPPKGDGPGGDPSPHTALGVFLSMRYLAERCLERPLADCTVAIQGVGNVGAHLAALLHEAGAQLIVADVDAKAAARTAIATGATVAGVDHILAAKADIFAPCALGAVLNGHSIAKLRARVVCGAANNQLAEAEDGERLADRGVVYAPDYVVNAGGIINVAGEYLGWSPDAVEARVKATPERLGAVLDHAALHGLATNEAADRLAEEQIGTRPRLVAA